ncbi:MAG: radical SAM protein [Elusimicrobia bacterium]|nr:radical SAM protein [Elusimicrobiota bacterium]
MPKNQISSKLTEISLNKNIPLIGTLELTYQCPLKCVHCYLPQTRGRLPVFAKKELSTDDWKKILRQLRKAGCLYIVFTGGEPLLRKDLAQLCEYAAKLNFSVKIFSTGFDLTEDLLKKLKDCSIASFEMSFYGKKNAHNRVTGNKNSFDRTLEAAKRIAASGIAVKLKSPLMRENFRDIKYIMDVCKKYGFNYSFDPIIAPANDGDKSNIKYRITKTQMGKLFKIPELNLSQECKAADIKEEAQDFFCGAGKNVFGINPYGEVYPCLQIPISLGNLKKRTFDEIWKKSLWLKKWRNLKIKDLKECVNCEYLSSCNRCPGLSLVEDGNLMGHSGIACDIAKMHHNHFPPRRWKMVAL